MKTNLDAFLKKRGLPKSAGPTPETSGKEKEIEQEKKQLQQEEERELKKALPLDEEDSFGLEFSDLDFDELINKVEAAEQKTVEKVEKKSSLNVEEFDFFSDLIITAEKDPIKSDKQETFKEKMKKENFGGDFKEELKEEAKEEVNELEISKIKDETVESFDAFFEDMPEEEEYGKHKRTQIQIQNLLQNDIDDNRNYNPYVNEYVNDTVNDAVNDNVNGNINLVEPQFEFEGEDELEGFNFFNDDDLELKPNFPLQFSFGINAVNLYFGKDGENRDHEEEKSLNRDVVRSSRILNYASPRKGHWTGGFQWDEEVRMANSIIFKNEDFRDQQREIINATKARRDVLALIVTGK
jgi:hypothetical protein